MSNNNPKQLGAQNYEYNGIRVSVVNITQKIAITIIALQKVFNSTYTIKAVLSLNLRQNVLFIWICVMPTSA